MKIISRDEEVFEFIRTADKATGQREIRQHFGITRYAASDILQRLVEQDRIKIMCMGGPNGLAPYYRPFDYAFVNPYLEGWCGAVELGLDNWMKDKVRDSVHEMRSQRNYAFQV